MNSLRTLGPDRGDRNVAARLIAVRLLLSLMVTVLIIASCGTSEPGVAPEPTPGPTLVAEPTPTLVAQPPVEEVEDAGPGGYGFDRSDPVAGITNIMDAFAADEATATCIYDAWGDVANVAPAELTTELMNFEICGTSIFQMITGDARFTGRDD